MAFLDPIRRALVEDDDTLAPYRQRMAMPLTVVCALLMTPFLWIHVVGANWVLAGATGAGQAVAIVCGVALSRGMIPVWQLALATVGVIGAISVSVANQGINGVFWSYPALFIAYFVLPRGTARVCAGLLIGTLGLVGLPVLGPAVTVRVVGTLVLILALVEVVLQVVKDLREALAREACTDALTGAWNRRQLGQLLSSPQAPARDPARGLMLMALDIDHFKRINDRHGHAVGDQVLIETVRRVNGLVRPGDQLFRTGGEEFLLALPDTTLREALTLAESLRQRIEATPMVPNGDPVTVSIGIARWLEGQDGDQALCDADRALYEAKETGRNRVRVAAHPRETADEPHTAA
jgi:diguanylate cyclase (GGDEF)-like protein